MRYKKTVCFHFFCTLLTIRLFICHRSLKNCGSIEDRSINCPKVSRSFLRKYSFQKREVRGSQTEKEQEPLLSFYASQKSKTIGHNVYGNPLTHPHTHTHTPTNSLLAGDSSKMRVYRGNGMMSVICFQIPQEAKMYSDASSKEPVCQCRRRKSLGFNPWVGKLSWKTGWKPTPVFLPGK